MSEPTYTADEAAAILGMSPDVFAASFAEVLPAMLADGTAHYEPDGSLVVDGG